jgi:UDP-2-acetamido-2,6-beta-L-arabino-hexul-4-ose reductase
MSPKRIAVTGAAGFLGWHVRCQAFARGIETVPIDRCALAGPDLAGALAGVDAVVHCAGVNRGTDSELVEGNLAAARQLAEAVRRMERPARIVYANSVQARGDGVYGAAKRKAAELLAGSAAGGFSDVVLPNLFGEHGRPYHHSFVATFCRDVADGRAPAEVRARELPLLHAQDAAEVLVGQADTTGMTTVEPAGEPVSVAGVLRLLREFAAAYRGCELPDLTGRFRSNLFHTYRSYLFPDRYPIALARHSDPRGSLVECVRTGLTGGQANVSSTVPGAVRGEHVHLHKFERFLVVDGHAEIALRRLFTDQVIRFSVDGEQPAIVDMPTMWAHRLTNVGIRPVTTLFWTSELHDPAAPDTCPCPVDRDGMASP